jgi:hypothetical protein
METKTDFVDEVYLYFYVKKKTTTKKQKTKKKKSEKVEEASFFNLWNITVQKIPIYFMHK